MVSMTDVAVSSPHNFLAPGWRPLLCCNFLTSNITFLYKKVGYPIKHEREIAEEGFSILLVLLLGIKESF